MRPRRAQVCFFAAAREAAGEAEAWLELPDADASTHAVVESVATQYPQLERLLPRCALALNGEYVEGADTRIKEGDEVALLPPMSGG